MIKNKKGFTLIELIVVMAIIAILASIAVPVTMRYVNKAKETSDDVILNSIMTNVLTEIAGGEVSTLDEIVKLNQNLTNCPYPVVAQNKKDVAPKEVTNNKVIAIYVKFGENSEKSQVKVFLYDKGNNKPIRTLTDSI